MEQKNTGGPAFPTAYKAYDGVGGFTTEYINGMELRDYFAAKAMQAFAACPDNYDPKYIPEMAYRLADDMLKAREA